MQPRAHDSLVHPCGAPACRRVHRVPAPTAPRGRNGLSPRRSAAIASLALLAACAGRAETPRSSLRAPTSPLALSAAPAPRSPLEHAQPTPPPPLRGARRTVLDTAWRPQSATLLVAHGPPRAAVEAQTRETGDEAPAGEWFVDVWDLRAGRLARTLDPGTGAGAIAPMPDDNRVTLGFSPDGRSVYTAFDAAESDGLVRLWDTATWALRAQHAVACMPFATFTPDGAVLIAGGCVGHFVSFDARGGRVLGEAQLWMEASHRGAEVLPLPDSRTMLLLVDSDPLTVRDVRTLRRLHTVRPPDPLPRDAGERPNIALNARGDLVAQAGVRGSITLVDVRTGATRAVVRRPRAGAEEGGSVIALTFSPDDRALATLDPDGAVTLWNGRTGARVAVLRVGAGAPVDITATTRLSFSDDGARLTAAGAPEMSGVWPVPATPRAEASRSATSNADVPAGADDTPSGAASPGGAQRSGASIAEPGLIVRRVQASQMVNPVPGGSDGGSATAPNGEGAAPDALDDLQLVRSSDGATLTLSTLDVAGRASHVVYNASGEWDGDERTGTDGGRPPEAYAGLIPAATARHHPGLLADFVAGQAAARREQSAAAVDASRPEETSRGAAPTR